MLPVDASGQFPVADFQRIRDGVVEAEPRLQAIGEESEAAGDEQRLRADALGIRASILSAPGDSLRRSS